MTTGMGLKIEILASSDVRRALTPEGDLRGDVAFQNDVNALLARVEQMSVPWRALAEGMPSAVPQRVVAGLPMGLPTPLRTHTLDGIGLAPLVISKVPTKVSSKVSKVSTNVSSNVAAAPRTTASRRVGRS
jgi:hypothetical protein